MVPLLELKGVTRVYHRSKGIFSVTKERFRAVDRVDLAVAPGEIVGLVGESGCGKSTLARLALGLERPDGGEVLFMGRPLGRLDGQGWRRFRRSVQMVFQDPMSSLNPKRTIWATLKEPLVINGLCRGRECYQEAQRLMQEVGLAPNLLHRYPHEFSGGQRQRIGLARALATRPSLVVADEPTSALDVSIQAQVINLMLDLHQRMELSFLFISHDLPLVHFVSSRVCVMYRGRLVEIYPSGLAEELDHHPYTSYLMASIPVPKPGAQDLDGGPLGGEEMAPESSEIAEGCNYRPLCPVALDRCGKERPQMVEVEEGHWVACHRMAP